LRRPSNKHEVPSNKFGARENTASQTAMLAPCSRFVPSKSELSREVRNMDSQSSLDIPCERVEHVIITMPLEGITGGETGDVPKLFPLLAFSAVASPEPERPFCLGRSKSPVPLTSKPSLISTMRPRRAHRGCLCARPAGRTNAEIWVFRLAELASPCQDETRS